MDYRVHITYDGLLEEEAADRLLDALEKQAGELGPVISSTAENFTVTTAITLGPRSFMADALAIVQMPIAAALEIAGIRARESGASVEHIGQSAAAAA